jgi:hypothetical protein
MQDAIPHLGFYVTKLQRKFFSRPWRPEPETVVGVPFGSFTMVGSQVREGK